VKIELGK